MPHPENSAVARAAKAHGSSEPDERHPADSPSFAIVGSGPAGCYTAQALRKAWPAAQITILEKLPVPYGLIRYGIAADHQGTKAVTRQFDRLFERDGVEFVGNVEIGAGLTLARLRDVFDVVILATGLATDRVLAIPGAGLAGVHGSGHFTRYLNSHPGDAAWSPVIGSHPVVIGNGNVALDLVRLLAKTPDDFAGSDIHRAVAGNLDTARTSHITVVGRSSPAEAKFDAAMLKELGRIPGVRFRVSDDSGAPADSAAGASRIAALEELAARGAEEAPRLTIDFHFGWHPVRLEGDGRVEAACFAHRDGGTFRIPADTVLSAIGFAPSDPTPDAHAGEIPGELYYVGWARRGAHGALPENRRDAKAVVEQIVQDLRVDGMRSFKPGLAGLPREILDRRVDFPQWQRIDAAEIAAADTGRIRSKLLTVADMLSVAHGDTMPATEPQLQGAMQ